MNQYTMNLRRRLRTVQFSWLGVSDLWRLNESWHHGAIFLIGVALWFLTHPYLGIVHDARIYTVMALHRLHPARYGNDPFFQFGAQDEFSIFSHVYAFFIESFGIAPAAQMLVLSAGVLWVGVSWALSRAVLQSPWASLAFFMLVSLPLSYLPNLNSPEFLLVVSEPFVTARVFSVAFGLFGVALLLRGRHFQASLWSTFALAFHPLMAVWTLLLVFLWRMNDRLIAGLGALVVLAVAVVAGADLFPVFRPMTGDWASLVRHTARIVFVAEWPNVATGHTFWMVGLLLVAGIFTSPERQRLFQLTALLALCGLLVAMVASYFFPSALIMQVQPWRALWLLTVITVVAGVDLCHLAWRDRGAALCALLILAVGYPLREAWGGYLAVGTWLFVSLRSGQLPRALIAYRHLLRKGAIAVAVSSAVFYVAIVIWRCYMIGAASIDNQEWFQFMATGIRATGGFGVIAIGAWLVCHNRILRPALPFVAIVALASAAYGWDIRSPRHRILEDQFSESPGTRLFAGLVSPEDVVYWPNGTERVWFNLQASSYAGSVQAIGIVFSEPRALELRERLARVAALGLNEDFLCNRPNRDAVLRMRYKGAAKPGPLMFDLHSYEAYSITPPGAQWVCADSKVDWIVLPIQLQVASRAQIQDPPLPRRRTPTTLHLYRCDDLRSLFGGLESHSPFP